MLREPAPAKTEPKLTRLKRFLTETLCESFKVLFAMALALMLVSMIAWTYLVAYPKAKDIINQTSVHEIGNKAVIVVPKP